MEPLQDDSVAPYNQKYPLVHLTHDLAHFAFP